MVSLRDAGITGLTLTGFLFSIASWRLLYHYSGLCPSHGWCFGEDLSNPRVEGLTLKRILHCLLWTAMAVEAVAYGDFAGIYSLDDDAVLSEKISYTLLDIFGRGVLEYSTFSIGTISMFRLARNARAGAAEKKAVFVVFPSILVVASTVLALSSICEAVVLFEGGYKNLDDFRASSEVYRMQLLIEGVGWGILSVIVAVCAGMIFKRISSLPTFSQVGIHGKRGIITKMLIPTITCSVCYLLRSAYMVADFVSRLSGSDGEFESGVAWWVGNIWVPTFIPAAMLLYSIRKRDRAPGTIDGVSDASLIPHPTSPEDAFVSYNRNIREIDESSSIRPLRDIDESSSKAPSISMY